MLQSANYICLRISDRILNPQFRENIEEDNKSNTNEIHISGFPRLAKLFHANYNGLSLADKWVTISLYGHDTGY